MKRLLMIALLGLVISSPAKAEPKKTIWSCKEPYTQGNILWLVEWGDKSYVKVFDERLAARYSLRGLKKRWDWGLASDGSYNVAIELKPGLTASYFDVSTSKDGTASPSATYNCAK